MLRRHTLSHLAPTAASMAHNVSVSVSAFMIRAAAQISLWFAIKREQRRLLALDDRALKDIGIGRGDAEREARRSGREIARMRCPR